MNKIVNIKPISRTAKRECIRVPVALVVVHLSDADSSRPHERRHMLQGRKIAVQVAVRLQLL